MPEPLGLIERIACQRRLGDRELRHQVDEILDDVLACPRCGGRLRLIAIVEDPGQVREVIAGLARSAERVDRAPPSRESFAANRTADVCA